MELAHIWQFIPKKEEGVGAFEWYTTEARQGPNDFLQNLEVVLVEEYNLICFQEDCLLRQKRKVDWLSFGDKNSQFIHSVINNGIDNKFML